MKRIVIFGGSGFIGRHLVSALSKDYEVVVISRFKRTTAEFFGDSVKVERLHRKDISKIIEQVDGAAAVINLAGANVGIRWTEAKMDKIRKSRLDIDSVVVRSVLASKVYPKVVMLGSGIGIYGQSRNTIDITEETPLGKRGFLTKLAFAHEEAIQQLEKLTRVVYLRSGMVLDNSDGALPKIAQRFKINLGGKVGDGRQWDSWIHIDDEVGAIKFLMEKGNCSGPYNLTSPFPVRNEEFSKILARTLGKPNYIAAPSFILKLVFGKMADELLLRGLKVLPSRLIEEGYKFKFEELENALTDIYSN